MDLPCLSSDRERAFAEAWKKENAPNSFTVPALRGMLYSRECRPGDFPVWGNYVVDGEVTQREAEVAATVIQWLGTNVGFCFLEEALKACGYSVVRNREARNA